MLAMLFYLIFSNITCVKIILLKKVSSSLTVDNGTVFSSDNDPQLIADAIPFALKTYESFLEKQPRNDKLLLSTGKAFCMYSYAFVYLPSDTISDIRINEKNEQRLRAKKLYLRAKEYCMKAFEVRHPGFNRLMDENKTDSALNCIRISDTSLLYWAAASWIGAFTADKFDMNLAVNIFKPVAMMNLLLKLNESYNNGSVHDFFISYYGSMPASMGGDYKKAREHFNRSIQLSEGKNISPYIALATTVCVAEQNIKEFSSLLEKVISLNIDDILENRLANTILQNKAKWLLKNRDNFFILDGEQSTDSIEVEKGVEIQ